MRQREEAVHNVAARTILRCGNDFTFFGRCSRALRRAARGVLRLLLGPTRRRPAGATRTHAAPPEPVPGAGDRHRDPRTAGTDSRQVGPGVRVTDSVNLPGHPDDDLGQLEAASVTRLSRGRLARLQRADSAMAVAGGRASADLPEESDSQELGSSSS